MLFVELMNTLHPYDWYAMAFLIICWWGSGWITENPPKAFPSVTAVMAVKRHEWMQVFIHRDPRIFDSQVVMSLQQSTSFFASTCVLAIGGALALWTDMQSLKDVAFEVAGQNAPANFWRIKIGLVIWLLTTGFLRFVWANRVFGYCSVVMASIADPAQEGSEVQARQAAELNIRAGINFNRGLRAVYFALGSLAWLIGPLALFISTCIVTWVILSREFYSTPRDILLGRIK